jgi:hypothetical protein
MTQNWDGHRIFPLKVVTLEENGSVRKSVRGMRITGSHWVSQPKSTALQWSYQRRFILGIGGASIWSVVVEWMGM